MLMQLVEQSAWATASLLDACEELAPTQLATTVDGTFGTIFETLHHSIESDGHYARRVAPQLWPASLAVDANDAWEASLGGADAFSWVRNGGLESERIERRRTAFLTGDHALAFTLLRARADAIALVWHTYASTEPDVAARCRYGPDRESTAAAQIVQAMTHGVEHREQVRAILSSLGLEPRDLSGLAWASSTGDARAVSDA